MGKQQKQTREKNYLHIVIGLVFLCLLIAFAFNGYTYAQFLTSGSGADGATVAKLYVNSPNTDSISVNFNGSSNTEQTIAFQVVNFNESVTNEVLFDYSIRVENAFNNLPLEYKLTCTSDVGDNVGSNTFFASEHDWHGGTLLANTQCTHNYTLTIRWQSGQYDADTYANEVDLIKITIDSEQVD